MRGRGREGRGGEGGEGFCRTNQNMSATALYTGILGFNVPLDTVWSFRRRGALSSDVHLTFSNGGPAT